jgi:hypothetical protein
VKRGLPPEFERSTVNCGAKEVQPLPLSVMHPNPKIVACAGGTANKIKNTPVRIKTNPPGPFNLLINGQFINITSNNILYPE